jgi:hypothetical protein
VPVESIVIAPRFNGPPATAHGGVATGLVADLLGGPVAVVSLRLPPPLEVALAVDRPSPGRVRLLDGDALVVEGEQLAPDALDDVVAPRTVDAAEAAAGAARYLRDVAEHGHVYPTCFGCGPERVAGDGLRCFAGRVPAGDVLATPWTPHPSIGEPDGSVPLAMVWAAIDCPSGFAAFTQIEPGQPALLARLSARVDRRPRVGEPLCVVSWPTGRDGRKLWAEVVLQGADGEALAVGRSLWIVLADR